MNKLLEKLVKKHIECSKDGHVAEYIPELARVNPYQLGISVHDGTKLISAGACYTPFTLQSVSKPLVLILALMDHGESYVFEKVGKEPTGDPFNSIVRLETYKKQKPYNPMINAGAISIAGLIKGASVDEKINRIVHFIRVLANNQEISVNTDVSNSEKSTGDRNRSIAYFLKDIGNIEGDPLETLDVYFAQCAIEITCQDLANIGMVLALDGKSPQTGEQLFPKQYAKIAKAYMTTCGMYDGSGEFAIQVGIPAKSGVGGGIVAIAPGKFGIGVFGPALNEKGNSIAGLALLKELSETLDLNIF